MSIVYLDTSLLVAALANEPRGSSARRAIATHRDSRPLISDWVVTEFSSAIGMKVRSRVFSDEEGRRMIRFFAGLATDSFTSVPIERAHFRAATELCENFGTGLRGPDALHLAIGHSMRAVILTLDGGMADAGSALGIDVRLIA